MRLSNLSQTVSRYRHALTALISLVLFSLALYMLHKELAHTHFSDLRTALQHIPAGSLLVALAATAASYLFLTGYDLLALRYLQHALPYRQVLLTSFIATAVGHNLGMAMLSGGAVRLRSYTAWGLGAAEVATIVALVGMTFGVGASFSASLVLLLEPGLMGEVLHVGQGAIRALGILLLVAVALYIGTTWVRQRPVRFRAWQFRLPSVQIALGQLVLSSLDLVSAALVLYCLLPAHAEVSFAVLLGVYIVALVAGIVSHVPGGLGVFETVLLLSLPQIPRDSLLVSILLYRCIYYLLPLALAALTAAALSTRGLHRHFQRNEQEIERLMNGIVPNVAGSIVLIVGAILLFSGALPAEPERLHALGALLPLALLESSHLLGSMAGLALIVLARALYRRIHIAYYLVSWLLVAGIVASLLKGLDYEEALVALFALLILWLGRRAFDRQSSLMASVFTNEWWWSILLVVGASVWLGLFSHKHVDYANDLWWQFAFDDDASRFLRASLLVMLATLGLALAQLLRAPKPEPSQPTPQDLTDAARIIRASSQIDAALALLGDKRLLFNVERTGFVMYQVQGDSWIAMGDPVGPDADRATLAWEFRELAEQHGGRIAFYQVPVSSLPLYADLGLGAVKLGEEAIVPLESFSLDGAARSKLRQAHHRGVRDGLRFEWAPAQAIPALIPQLRQISDAWLAGKYMHEKGFSLGYFQPDYLAQCPCVLVWQQENLLAFANILSSANHEELSIDLMRHMPEAPNGLMDYLFIELMLYGAREGYARFNLGMAPLSGLETQVLAPVWSRIGNLLFKHGESFYGFQGLRAYKEKFNPVWEPRYLAAPARLGLPVVLLDAAALIAGGVKEVFWK